MELMSFRDHGSLWLQSWWWYSNYCSSVYKYTMVLYLDICHLSRHLIWKHI